MEHTGQREWRPLTVDVRLSSGADTSVWSPQERIELRARREGGGVRLAVDGPEAEYAVRFIEPAVGSVRASGEATLSRQAQVDGVTVVEVRGSRFELTAQTR